MSVIAAMGMPQLTTGPQKWVLIRYVLNSGLLIFVNRRENIAADIKGRPMASCFRFKIIITCAHEVQMGALLFYIDCDLLGPIDLRAPDFSPS